MGWTKPIPFENMRALENRLREVTPFLKSAHIFEIIKTSSMSTLLNDLQQTHND